MISDPMAGLDSTHPGDGQGSNIDGGLSTKEFVDPMTMARNMQRIDRIQNVMAIVAGCVTGICGRTGLSGFVCFALWHLLVCMVIWFAKMNCNLSAYTKQSWFAYMSTGMQQFALSFTLFWTLFYGLVYLY